MRYYNIIITRRGQTTPFRQYNSFPNGQNDPGALNIVLDAYVTGFATPVGLSVLQIWGVAFQDLTQASNFTNCLIQVYAGFQKGLPLNNPQQANLIIGGYIYQAFANWQGTEMMLNFVIAYDGGVASQQSNVSFSWKAGTTLTAALASTLSSAFPNVKQVIDINPKLVLTHDETGVYESLPAFAQTLKPLTQAIIGGNYPGVDILATPNSIKIFDGTKQSTPIQIAYQDLMGQPTWINQQTIQIMCPMRGDLSVNDYIAMPKGILGNPSNPAGAPGAVTTTPASQPQLRQQSVFSGTFQIIQVHYMGIFRQPDGMAWVTVIDAVNSIAQPPPSSDSLSVAP